jgi:hypothetical protein
VSSFVFFVDTDYSKRDIHPKLDIHVSVHHDTIYDNDQQDATV